MNYPMAVSKILGGLAAVALFAATQPAAAAPEGANKAAMATAAARKTASSEAEARSGESCAVAGGKEACQPPAGFPPLDMAASLFSAMTGCSRDGI